MKELPEIPWGKLIGHLVWIAGAALVLAAFSYHEWRARRDGLRLGDVLKRHSFRKALAAGGVLAAVGASAAAEGPLTAALAAAAAFSLAAWIWKLVRRGRNQ